MTTEEQPTPDMPDEQTTPDPSPVPETENEAETENEPDESAEVAIGEDDPSLLGRESRVLAADEGEGVATGEPSQAAADLSEADDSSDAGAAPDEPAETGSTAAARPVALDREFSTSRIAGELRRIEKEVRTLLEDRDPRRKRKLAGSVRWAELEEDILSWRFVGRINEDDLRQLQRLVSTRNYLFTRLRFLATTRPIWNS